MSHIPPAVPVVPPSRFETAKGRFLKYGFGSPPAVAISVLVFAVLGWIAWSFLDWAVFRAVWSKENVEQCSARGGACWAVIDARHRLILFGTYPFDQH